MTSLYANRKRPAADIILFSNEPASKTRVLSRFVTNCSSPQTQKKQQHSEGFVCHLPKTTYCSDIVTCVNHSDINVSTSVTRTVTDVISGKFLELQFTSDTRCLTNSDIGWIQSVDCDTTSSSLTVDRRNKRCRESEQYRPGKRKKMAPLNSIDTFTSEEEHVEFNNFNYWKPCLPDIDSELQPRPVEVMDDQEEEDASFNSFNFWRPILEDIDFEL